MEEFRCQFVCRSYCKLRNLTCQQKKRWRSHGNLVGHQHCAIPLHHNDITAGLKESVKKMVKKKKTGGRLCRALVWVREGREGGRRGEKKGERGEEGGV